MGHQPTPFELDFPSLAFPQSTWLPPLPRWLIPGRKTAGEFIAFEWIFRRLNFRRGCFGGPAIVQSTQSAVCCFCAHCMSELGRLKEKKTECIQSENFCRLRKSMNPPKHNINVFQNPPPLGVSAQVGRKPGARHIKRHFVLTFPTGCLLCRKKPKQEG